MDLERDGVPHRHHAVAAGGGGGGSPLARGVRRRLRRQVARYGENLNITHDAPEGPVTTPIVAKNMRRSELALADVGYISMGDIHSVGLTEEDLVPKKQRSWMLLLNSLSGSAIFEDLDGTGREACIHAMRGGEIILGGVNGGNNWPLRGGKFSNFEGGIRGNAFVSGGFVPEARRGTKLDGYVT